MKKLSVFLCVLALVFSTAGHAGATLLGSADLSFSAGTRQPLFTELDLAVSYDDGSMWSNKIHIIFDDLSVTPASIGTEYFITSTGPNADPEFDNFVAMLTNGIDDRLWLLYTPPGAVGPGGTGNLESNRFFGGSGGPDFQGSTVNRLGLLINNLTFDSPGSDPNGDGVWTDYSADVTLNVYDPSAVPEPSTMLLIGTGLVGLLAFRRKFKS